MAAKARRGWIALVCMVSLVVPLATASLPTAPISLSEQLESYLQARLDEGTFMGAVLVARGDEIVLSKGYGLADVERNVPNTPLTAFRLGSVTKAFTAVAMLQLQEQGLLNVQNPISAYLPDFPEGDRITVFQLLNHTSGVPDYVWFPDVLEKVSAPISLDDLIALIAEQPLEFAPGRSFSYSNSGYVLCAKIIEQVSGQPYGQYVKTHILDPAGMTHSGYDFYDPASQDERAVGYHFTGEDYVPVPLWDTSWAAGAGALYSTVEDMLRWSRALDAGALLSAGSMANLFRPVGAAKGYSYGWYIGSFLEHRRVYHGGYIFGFRADITRYPDDGLVLVTLSNLDRADTKGIAEDLAAMAFGQRYEAPVVRTPATIDPALYDAYVGRYDSSEILGPGAVSTVFLEDGHLVYQSNSRYDWLALPVVLYPESETVFFDKISQARYEFVVGADGAVIALDVADPYENRFPRLGSTVALSVGLAGAVFGTSGPGDRRGAVHRNAGQRAAVRALRLSRAGASEARVGGCADHVPAECVKEP